MNTEPWRNWKSFLYTCAGFTILMIAANGNQGLIAQIYDQAGYHKLGKLLLMAFYIGFAFFFLYAATFIKIAGYKLSFCMAALAYALSFFVNVMFTGCKAYPDTLEDFCEMKVSFYILHIFSFFSAGCASSVIWLASLSYITLLASKEHQATYYGIYFTLVSSSLFLGYIVPTFWFMWFGKFGYFVLLTALALLSMAIFMVFVTNEENSHSQNLLQDSEAGHDISKVPTDLNSSADIAQHSPGKLMTKTVSLMGNPKLKTWLTYMIFFGMFCGMMYAYLYELVTVASEGKTKYGKIQRSAIALTLLAFFGVISGCTVSKQREGWNVLKGAVTSLMMMLMTLITSALVLWTRSYALCLVAACLWGVSDNYGNALISSVMKTIYGEQSEGLLAPRFAHAFGVILCFLLRIALKENSLGTFLVIIIGCQVATTLIIFMNRSNILTPSQEINQVVRINRHSL